MNNEHVLLILLGKSASGKTTLATKLCEKCGLSQINSYTTRPPRVKNEQGHIFVSEQDYEEMKQNGDVAIETQIAGYHYWPTVQQLYDNDIFVCDYIGLKKLRELGLPNLRLVTVLINVPDDVREHRALEYRKDGKDKFRVRSFAEREQFREMLKNADFEYSVSNVEWSKAYSILKYISDVEGVWKNHMKEKAEL